MSDAPHPLLQCRLRSPREKPGNRGVGQGELAEGGPNVTKRIESIGFACARPKSNLEVLANMGGGRSVHRGFQSATACRGPDRVGDAVEEHQDLVALPGPRVLLGGREGAPRRWGSRRPGPRVDSSGTGSPSRPSDSHLVDQRVEVRRFAFCWVEQRTGGARGASGQRAASPGSLLEPHPRSPPCSGVRRCPTPAGRPRRRRSCAGRSCS